jgi:hypothetical protein
MSEPLATNVDPIPSSAHAGGVAGRAKFHGIREGAAALVAAARSNRLFTAAAVGTGLLAIGGLGPQANATTNVSVASINIGTVTTQSAVPGCVYILAALAAAVGLVNFLRSGDRDWLWPTRIAAAIGIVGALITYLQNAADSATGIGGTGWGFYVVIVSSCVLGVAARRMSRRATSADD